MRPTWRKARFQRICNLRIYPLEAGDSLGLASLDEEGSEQAFYAVLAWASPGLPDPRSDRR